MAGFRVQDYYIFFSKSNSNGRHCQKEDCIFKRNDSSHYHCKFYDFTKNGYSEKRMANHIQLKHPSEITLGLSNSKLEKTPILSECSGGLYDAQLSDVEPPCPASEFPPSPLKSLIVKKSKMSTPISAKPGQVQLASPSLSPLPHKSFTVSRI